MGFLPDSRVAASRSDHDETTALQSHISLQGKSDSRLQGREDVEQIAQFSDVHPNRIMLRPDHAPESVVARWHGRVFVSEAADAKAAHRRIASGVPHRGAPDAAGRVATGEAEIDHRHVDTLMRRMGIEAADMFHIKPAHLNEMQQIDFIYSKIIGWRLGYGPLKRAC